MSKYALQKKYKHLSKIAVIHLNISISTNLNIEYINFTVFCVFTQIPQQYLKPISAKAKYYSIFYKLHFECLSNKGY